jgi:hypothetical protein
MNRFLLTILVFFSLLTTGCLSRASKKNGTSSDSAISAPSNEIKKIPINEITDWVDTIYDKMNGTSFLMGKHSIIIANSDSSNYILINFSKPMKGRTFWINLHCFGAGNCIDEGAEADLLFEGDIRSKIYNHFKFNCDNVFTEYFRSVWRNNKTLDILKKNKLKSIRVFTINGAVTLDLTADNSIMFLRTINEIDK